MEKVKAHVHARWSPTISGFPPVPPPSAPRWTTPPLAPPTAPPAPSVRSGGLTAPQSAPCRGASDDPAEILDELVATVAGVRSALLASVDGFGIARSRSMSDEPAHPAVLAAALGLAHQLVAMSGGDRLRQLMVDHDGGLLLLLSIGDLRVLAVLTSSVVEQRQIHSFVRARFAALAGAAS